MLGKFFRAARRVVRGVSKRFSADVSIESVPVVKEASSGVAKASVSTSDAAEQKKVQRKKRPRWNVDQFEVEEVEGKSRFHDITLPVKVMHGIADLGFEYCTPIQAQSLPHLLEGKDLVGHASTGTGKTAVFLITILTRLLREKRQGKKRTVKALILAPTRELVMQIAKDARLLGKYCNLQCIPVFGGTDYDKQRTALANNRAEIVVATPGRLLDFLWKNVVSLDECEILVIDEADRMLDMGFIPDVRRIIGKLPGCDKRQTLMFSATITDEVRRLAYQWCEKPVHVALDEEEDNTENIDERVYLATSDEKFTILYNIITEHADERIIVFTNQKNEAKRLAERLMRHGVSCGLLTGDVQQQKRMDRLNRFRSGALKVLVATDVAGRGIHVDDISFVVNYTLPYEPEDYVHRIGRTGRAGAAGTAISFACEESAFSLPAIEEFLEKKIECVLPEEELLVSPPPPSAKRKPSSTLRRKRGGGKRKARTKTTSPAKSK